MTPFDDDQVAIDNLKISRNLYSHEELASLDVVVGAFQFDAKLTLDGNLRIPDGVYISIKMEERATEDAKQQFMSALTQRWWGKPRASGTVHRIRACEEATRG